MTVSVCTSHEHNVRRYLVIPDDTLPHYQDQGVMRISLGNDRPLMRPPRIIIEHNERGLAAQIHAVIDELPATEKEREAAGFPPFEVRDLSDWEAHLSRDGVRARPDKKYTYRTIIKFQDSHLSNVAANDLLEELLDKLKVNGLMMPEDALGIIAQQEYYAGHYEAPPHNGRAL